MGEIKTFRDLHAWQVGMDSLECRGGWHQACFISRERAQPLADSLDRLQKLLYGIRREKLGRLGVSVATTGAVALLFFLRFG